MQPNNPFAIIEKDGAITLYEGHLHRFETLAELQGFYNQKVSTLIFMTPFRTIRERGFEAHGDEPILAIEVEEIKILTREQIETILSDKLIVLEKSMQPVLDDESFAHIVREIQDKEIAGGNICQMVLSQPYIGKIQDFSQEDVESAFRNCLKQKGQYLTVLFSDGGENYFVSLTPEQHLGVTPDEVTMNPIAGTMRKGDISDMREQLLQFISDPKETKELFHVLDEELKMMEAICEEGGRIEGPFLHQNGAVIHTEYRIIGKRDKKQEPISILRSTLHAPTLTGGPIKSAVSLIAKYESISRGYYGGEIGILTPDGHLDTAITIRTAHFKGDGTVTIQAGAGITRDSDPMSEADEVRLKTGGMRVAITGVTTTTPDVSEILKQNEILEALIKRNEHLSRFHFCNQTNTDGVELLKGRTVTVINNEDEFAKTLGRMMMRMGMNVRIIDTLDFDPVSVLSDIIVIGPGPGDINDMNDPKMKMLASHTKRLFADKRNILGICLGHQSVAREMGMKVERLRTPTQGEQREINFFGKSEKLGFYNSFCPTEANFDIFSHVRFTIPFLREENISGFQFHPESIMSENGFEILRDELIRILSYKEEK